MSDVAYTDTITMKVERLEENSFGGGFRQGWIHGDNADQLSVDDLTEGKPQIEFDLDSGAGLGNPFLQLTVRITKNGETTVIREHANMRTLCTDWVNRIVSDAEAEATS